MSGVTKIFGLPKSSKIDMISDIPSPNSHIIFTEMRSVYEHHG